MHTEHLPSSPSMRIRPGVMLLLVVGGLVLLFMIVLTGTWVATNRRLAAELEKVRAVGEPVSAEDMEAFYKAPPEGRDTTQLWLAAIAPLDTPAFQGDAKDLPIVGEGQNTIPYPGEPWPQLEAAEQLLSAYSSSLDKMHQAAREGGQARFPTRFADGIAMLMPHLQRLRVGARLLELEAAVAAHRGRPDDALEALVAMSAAARSLEQEPVLLSQLVRMAVTNIARERIVWLLSAGVLGDEQLKRLDAELSAADYHDSVRRALVGERAIGIQTFADPAPLGADALSFRPGFMANGDETVYLQIMSEMIAAAELAGSERTRALERAEAQLKMLAGGTSGKIRYPVTLLIVPAVTAFTEAANRNEADRDATRIAVAVERFRLSDGRLPSTLDELVPKYLDRPPSDPYSGSALKYRVDATEYLVYSVGSNGVDDGGVSEGPGLPPDVVVRVRIKDEGSRPVSAGP